MNATQTVNDLLQVLADRGLSEDAIVNVRDGLWAQANETFMDEVLAALTDEDLQNVEASNTQEEANEKFIQIYKEKTGKDMQEQLNTIIDQFAQQLIQKYKVEEPEPAISFSTAPDTSGEEAPKEEEQTIHDLS